MTGPALNLHAPQTLDLLRSRRSGSAKTMKGPGPDRAQIDTLLACASRVPDHGKLAPWRFILFSGEARTRFGNVLAEAVRKSDPSVSDERVLQERNRFLRAPVVIGVVSKVRKGVPIPEWEQVLSAGASCQTILVAAHAMGFVANWITEWYAYDPHVRAHLQLAEEERIAGFIYIGHPAEPLVDRPRPALETIVTEY